jgi:DNA adenine methylase
LVGGKQLYTHHQLDHELLFQVTATVSGDFLMTYDDTPHVRALAQAHNFRAEQVPVRTAHHRWKKELIIRRNFPQLTRGSRSAQLHSCMSVAALSPTARD